MCSFSDSRGLSLRFLRATLIWIYNIWYLFIIWISASSSMDESPTSSSEKIYSYSRSTSHIATSVICSVRSNCQQCICPLYRCLEFLIHLMGHHVLTGNRYMEQRGNSNDDTHDLNHFYDLLFPSYLSTYCIEP